jgi:ABC-type Na+ efflux pump permease subunit
MLPGQIMVLLVLVFAVLLAWSYSRGRTLGVRLYAITVVIAASLLGGSIAQLLNAEGAVEALNVTAIALSLAALASHPSLWEEEMQGDLRRIRLVQPVRARDLLSWRGWLKLVDRIGAKRAALAYLGIFALAIAAALGATLGAESSDRTIYTTLASLTPAGFAVLSGMRIYRGARRLVPGA